MRYGVYREVVTINRGHVLFCDEILKGNGRKNPEFPPGSANPQILPLKKFSRGKTQNDAANFLFAAMRDELNFPGTGSSSIYENLICERDTVVGTFRGENAVFLDYSGEGRGGGWQVGRNSWLVERSSELTVQEGIRGSLFVAGSSADFFAFWSAARRE